MKFQRYSADNESEIQIWRTYFDCNFVFVKFDLRFVISDPENPLILNFVKTEHFLQKYPYFICQPAFFEPTDHLY